MLSWGPLFFQIRYGGPRWLRIPPKLDTCSAANWTVVPSQTGHPFQAKLDTLDATARG